MNPNSVWCRNLFFGKLPLSESFVWIFIQTCRALRFSVHELYQEQLAWARPHQCWGKSIGNGCSCSIHSSFWTLPSWYGFASFFAVLCLEWQQTSKHCCCITEFISFLRSWHQRHFFFVSWEEQLSGQLYRCLVFILSLLSLSPLSLSVYVSDFLYICLFEDIQSVLCVCKPTVIIVGYSTKALVLAWMG